jgi:proteasome lid subunit RPN8/RPN11
LRADDPQILCAHPARVCYDRIYSCWLTQLAVVAMAEHGTRSQGKNTTGLLFGTTQEIIDTVDVPESAFDTVVALQMAVYPHQQVVGWYRVGTASQDITGADLATSRQLKARFPEARYLVTLDGKSNVAVFELDDSSSATCTNSTESSVLINTEFSLDTTTAERIAVERLLREDKGPAKIAQMDNSIDALVDRIDTLLTYLASGAKCDPSNLRRIQSVICNARLLNATKDPVADIEGLAVLADTVALAKAYTETSRPRKGKSSGKFTI